MCKWVCVVAALLAGCMDLPAESYVEQDICAPQQSRLNLVWRKASHNTYEAGHLQGASITSMLDAGIFDIELDLRDTYNFSSVANDWFIAHNTTGPLATTCSGGMLSGCLSDLMAWHSSHVGHPLVTVWLDKKQDWQNFVAAGKGRNPAQLDVMISELGPALFTPGNMGGIDLRTQVISCGWPSIYGKTDRFMFVLTTDRGATTEGNRLRRYVTNRGAYANAWVAPSASSIDEVWTPPGFDNASTAYVAIYNFEWSSPSTSGECTATVCEQLSEAHAQHFLARTYDLTDPEEYFAAKQGSGDGFSNFLPLDAPWDPAYGAANFGDY